MQKITLLILFSIGMIQAQVLFSISPEVSKSSWMIPLEIKTQFSESISMKYSGQLFNTNHPFDHYIWYSYQLDERTYVNTESFIRCNKDPWDIVFGRKHNPVGYGKMSGLFISPTAPSLDQITFSLNNHYGFNYRHSIMRLDNRFRELDGVKNVVNRWYYLNQVGYNYKDVIEINLTDAVISTGYNRDLEWYYANPLVNLFIERKHQIHRREGQDSTSVIGIGDNDNHFVGGDWIIRINQLDIYGEWVIDEWQLAHEKRDNMQTVFGILIGLGYESDIYRVFLEYSLAGPWLYVNRGLYGSLEQHMLPIGLRNPHSHSLGIGFNVKKNKDQILIVHAYLEEKGEQSFETPWNAWDNKVNIFDFTEILPLEIKIIYHNRKNKYFNTIGIYHNWVQSNETYFVLGCDLNFKLE